MNTSSKLTSVSITSLALTVYLTRSNLRGKGVYFGSYFRGTFHTGRESTVAGGARGCGSGSMRLPAHIQARQEGEREGMPAFLSLLFFCPVQDPISKDGAAQIQGELNLSGCILTEILQGMPQWCLRFSGSNQMMITISYHCLQKGSSPRA